MAQVEAEGKASEIDTEMKMADARALNKKVSKRRDPTSLRLSLTN